MGAVHGTHVKIRVGVGPLGQGGVGHLTPVGASGGLLWGRRGSPRLVTVEVDVALGGVDDDCDQGHNIGGGCTMEGIDRKDSKDSKDSKARGCCDESGEYRAMLWRWGGRGCDKVIMTPGVSHIRDG